MILPVLFSLAVHADRRPELRFRSDGRTSLLTLLAIAICLVCFDARPVYAQRYWGLDQVPYCARERSSDACKAQSLSVLLEKLDLPAAEALAADGYVGVRLFRYDAFGTIWPAAIFISKPTSAYRREGVAEARTILGDGHLAVLTRPVWESGWLELDAIVEAVRGRIEPEPEPDMATLIAQRRMPRALRCLDPPKLIVEVFRDGQVQRWWPIACDPDAASLKVQDVADIVAAAFPACGHIPIERYGRGIGRLRACLTISGEDPVAAAEVMAVLSVNVGGDTRVAYEADRQADDVTLLAIDGRRFNGRQAVEAAMRDGGLGRRWLRILRAEGDPEGVLVRGQLVALDTSGTPDPLSVTLSWQKDDQGEWRIASWEIEQRPEGVP